MLEAKAYDYALLRVVPRIADGQFCNVGVIVFARSHGFLACALVPADVVAAQLRALSSTLALAWVQRHLEGVRAVCAGEATAGPIAALPQPERFHWLTAARSSMIQTSTVHSGRCEDPAATLRGLLARLTAAR